MVYIVLFGLVIFIFILLNWFINAKAYGKKTKKVNSQKNNPRLSACPLCSSDLLPGENLVSRVYRPMTVGDQLCTINGCPHCYPVPEAGVRRVCPVCHKDVDTKDGHLVARLFNKAEGKKHVIVTGCNHCCRGVK